jgi:hypothetical protein
MKKAILGLLLGAMAFASIPAQANNWGSWGDTKKGRVESARIRKYYSLAKAKASACGLAW